MGKRVGLADEIISLAAGIPGVRRAFKEQTITGNGKRRVKIVRNPDEGCVRFSVSDPDHPRHTVRVDANDPTAVTAAVEKFLNKEGVHIL